MTAMEGLLSLTNVGEESAHTLAQQRRFLSWHAEHGSGIKYQALPIATTLILQTLANTPQRGTILKSFQATLLIYEKYRSAAGMRWQIGLIRFSTNAILEVP